MKELRKRVEKRRLKKEGFKKESGKVKKEVLVFLVGKGKS